jgi:hypothetical protein
MTKPLKLKHFADVQAVLDYVFSELSSTLEDDLNRMAGEERRHYTTADRKAMRDRIADIRAIEPRVQIQAPVIVLKTNCAPVVHEVFANVPGAKVLFVDEDTESCDSSSICDVEGEKSWVGMYPADYTPARVETVVRQVQAQGVKP